MPTLTELARLRERRGPTLDPLPASCGSGDSVQPIGRTSWRSDLLFVAGVGLLSALLLGYHGAAEDGGIYTAALAARLNPALFAHDRLAGMDWVLGPTRFTVFVPAIASVLGTLHLPLTEGLLLLQIASVLATVGALLRLARLCFPQRGAARWATLLVSLAAGLPIAGTSLYLLDPCVTARSVTTPLLLLAVELAVRRRWLRAAMLWLAAAALHPLMAVWAAPALLALRCLQTVTPLRRMATVALTTLAALGGVCLWSAPADALERQIADTRPYWFLSQWHWYEVVGALLPIALLGTLANRRITTRFGLAPAVQPLAMACVFSATLGLAAALLFAHATGTTMAVARLQPLRTLHLFYAVFLLLFAGVLVNAICRRAAMLVPLGICIAGTMAWTQHTLYPASGYLELPWQTPQNAWAQAFQWAANHTPTDAIFALDPQYTAAPGEDAQGFRALALRSVLPDRGKDAGIAAVVPTLNRAWFAGVTAGTNLATESDRERIARLTPLGVSWIILPAAARTALACPFHNDAAMVCRLPRQLTERAKAGTP